MQALSPTFSCTNDLDIFYQSFDWSIYDFTAYKLTTRLFCFINLKLTHAEIMDKKVWYEDFAHAISTKCVLVKNLRKKTGQRGSERWTMPAHFFVKLYAFSIGMPSVNPAACA